MAVSGFMTLGGGGGGATSFFFLFPFSGPAPDTTQWVLTIGSRVYSLMFGHIVQLVPFNLEGGITTPPCHRHATWAGPLLGNPKPLTLNPKP